jgi:hypothetical protein
MKKYTIETSELDIVLQVWQDLNQMRLSGRLQAEDKVIGDILEQIILSEYGTIPEGYESVRQDVTEEEAKAMGIQLPNMGQTQDVGEREDRHLI